MTKRHKHYDAIVAWAEGKQLQFRNNVYKDWTDVNLPIFLENTEYRIKPEPKKYRVYEWKLPNNSGFAVVQPDRYAAAASSSLFVRWVDEEREVPEDA